MADPNIKALESRMQGAIKVLGEEMAGLRTGRASTSLLDRVVVNAYGSEMPLGQVATVSVPEARLLSVSVWDRGNVSAVEKAIRESGLGLNPASDGQTIRVPVPEIRLDVGDGPERPLLSVTLPPGSYATSLLDHMGVCIEYEGRR